MCLKGIPSPNPWKISLHDKRKARWREQFDPYNHIYFPFSKEEEEEEGSDSTYPTLPILIQSLTPRLRDKRIINGNNKDLSSLLNVGMFHESGNVGVGTAWA